MELQINDGCELTNTLDKEEKKIDPLFAKLKLKSRLFFSCNYKGLLQMREIVCEFLTSKGRRGKEIYNYHNHCWAKFIVHFAAQRVINFSY